MFSIRQGTMTATETLEVCACFGLLEESWGRLLVRDTYEVMLRRFEAAYKMNHIPGVVITGQPGIGTLLCLVSGFPDKSLTVL